MLDGFQRLGRQRLAVDIDLDTPGHVLQHHESATVKHDASSHLHRDRRFCQLFLGLVDVFQLQVVAVAVATEVIGENVALGAFSSQFFLALKDQAVFFLVDGVLVQRLFAHGLKMPGSNE